MLLPMLKAVVNMLDEKDPDIAKVECARAVLAEIIKHLESNPLSLPKDVIYDGSRTYIDDELDPEAQEAQKELT